MRDQAHAIGHFVGSYAQQYETTISRIVNGYRFPKDIPDRMYDFYADVAYAKEVKTDFDQKYLKLMKTLRPEWKHKPKAKHVNYISPRTRAVQKVYKYDCESLECMFVYDSIEKAAKDNDVNPMDLKYYCDAEPVMFHNAYWRYSKTYLKKNLSRKKQPL